MAHVIVDAGRIRPVGFGRDDVEALGFDQSLRDPRPHAVELGGPVTGLADQHDTCVADPIQQRLEIGIFKVC